MSNAQANTGQINEACGPQAVSLTRLVYKDPAFRPSEGRDGTFRPSEGQAGRWGVRASGTTQLPSDKPEPCYLGLVSQKDTHRNQGENWLLGGL